MTKELIETLEECLVYFEDRMDVNWEGTGPNEEMSMATRISDTIAKARAKSRVPTPSKWMALKDWHSDYGDCLFHIFSSKNEWIEGIYTNPLCSDWPEYITDDHKVIFKQVPFLEGDFKSLLEGRK